MKSRTAIILIAISTLGGVCFGIDNTQSNKMPEIIVTASRQNQKASEMPANVTVISSDEIQKAGNSSVVDVLNKQQGIVVRSLTGSPSTAEVSMRGFGENSHGRVLVLLDGHRLNRPDMTTINWFQVPVSSVERIEIIRGGNSALYGDYAVGGVINIVTRKDAGKNRSRVSIEAGSFNTTDASLNLGGQIDKASWSINTERFETDGYRDHSHSLSESGSAKLEYDFAPSVYGYISVLTQQNDYEWPGNLSKEQVKDNPKQSLSPDDETENKYYNIMGGLTVDATKNQLFDLCLSFDREVVVSDFATWASYADTTIDSLALLPKYQINSDLAGHKNRITTGLDYYRDVLSLKRFPDKSREIILSTPDVKKETLGGYVKDEFHMTDIWAIEVGGRVETAEIKANVDDAGNTVVDDSVRHNENAGDIAVICKPDDNSKIFLRFGTVYRYPFVNEQVSYFGYGSDYFYNDIKPEKGMNTEVGTDFQINKNSEIGVTAFLLNMQDEINWDAATQRNQNLDKTKHKGLEFNASHTFSGIAVINAGYTLSQTTFRNGANEGKTIPLVPEQKITFNAELFLPADMFLDTAVTYTGSSYLGSDYSNTGEKLDGYTVADVTLRHIPSYLSGFEIFVKVENLFDEQYSSLAYKGVMTDGYYPAPGRSFKTGISYQF